MRGTLNFNEKSSAFFAAQIIRSLPMTIVQTNPCSKVAAIFRVGGLAIKAPIRD